MTKPTVSAAGGAMPAESHETPSLLTIADALDQTRFLITAAALLAANTMDNADPLHSVIVAAEDKLDGARAMLEAIRGQKAEVADV